MQTTDIEREVSDFVISNFMFGQPSDLQSDESLLAKGVIDSTGVLELVAFLEEHYMITVEDDEVIPDNLDSVRNVAKYVAKKLNHTA